METDGAVGQGEAANGNVVDGGLKPRREDPKLIRTSVKIAYTSSDGYRAEMKCPGGKGTKHRVTGEEVPPEAALLSGLRELARLTALYGFEKKALEEFTKAQADVAEWKANR